jgi:hypothetical protein
MSQLNSPPGQELIATKLVPSEVLYYYDEPLIFTAEARLGPVICSKTDQRDGLSEYLVVPTTKSIVGQLRSGGISVRTAFSQPWCWLVETDEDFNLVKSSVRTLDTLPPDYLPEVELGLYPHHGRILDQDSTRVKRPAYLSVHFSGRELADGTMGFGVFKTLVDEIYVALRKVFLPAFERLVSSGVSEVRAARLLQIPIRQPKFASLTVEIDEPRIDTRRLKETIPVDLKHTRAEIQKAGTSFLEEMEAIDKIAREKPLTISLATSYFSTIEALSQIAPTDEAAFEQVEIIGRSTNGAPRRIVIDTSLGDRIREAHRLAARSERDFRGKIIEFNEKSGTFVLRQADGREVTCALSTRDLAESKSAFVEGQRVTVRGILQRRVRRDYLTAKEIIFSENE